MSYANLGVIYQSLQRWEESEIMIKKAIKFGPSIGELVSILGNGYTHLPSRLDEAKKELDKGLEMSPDSPDTYIYLAQWSLKMNQPEEAWNYLEQGLEKGIGNGQLDKGYLDTQTDLEEMRKDAKWDKIILKYIPDVSHDD